MNATPETLTGCRIVVVNDILGTREETVSPQTAKEAMANHGAVALAKRWMDYYGEGHSIDAVSQALYDAEPIAVCIHKTDNQIIVRWHVTGDLETARTTMQRVLDGKWGFGNEQEID